MAAKNKSYNGIRRHLTLLLGALMILGMAASAYAHAAVLWCYIEGDTVHVEAFFMGGKKVQHGQIVVIDANEKKLLEGTTDKEGNFSFKPPIKDDMKILLMLDAGHASTFDLTKQDFEEAAAESAGK